MKPVQRCPWCLGSDLEREYHDQEWGVPVHDSRLLFEFLTLEGAQAGLSWRTILQKREGYRRVFLNFDIEALARLSDAQLLRSLQDPGIVRNRLKVGSVRSNAQAVLKLREAGHELNDWLWAQVGGEVQINHWQNRAQVPATSPKSDQLSRALKRAGFRFVGSTICYAFMQAVGMVNDHLLDCYRQAELAPSRAAR